MRGCNIIKDDTLEYISGLPLILAQGSSVRLSGQKSQLITKCDEIPCLVFGVFNFVLIFHLV